MKLEWQTNSKQQFKVISDDMPVIIGRSEDCDIVLDDFCVSRHHVVVGYEDGYMKLRTLNSKNPIMVNGHFPIGSSDTYTLQDGDSFFVGRVEMKATTINLQRAQATTELKLYCSACGGRAAGNTLNCVWCGEQLYDQEISPSH